jgi:hypothetical protein
MKSKGIHIRLSRETWERAKAALKGPDPKLRGSLTQLVNVALEEKLERVEESETVKGKAAESSEDS